MNKHTPQPYYLTMRYIAPTQENRATLKLKFSIYKNIFCYEFIFHSTKCFALVENNDSDNGAKSIQYFLN